MAQTAGPLAAQQDVSDYEIAVAARMQGEPARAIELLNSWLGAFPGDVDAQLQLGYAYLALGRIEDARGAFNAVLARAPEYRDARDGLEAAEQWRKSQKHKHWIRLESAVSDLTRGRGRGNDIVIDAFAEISEKNSISAGVSRYQRFGFQDIELSAAFVRRTGENMWLRVGGSLTPSADFRARAAVKAGVDWRIANGDNATILGADVSWRQYPLQTVWTFSPALTRYFANGGMSVTLRADAVAAEGVKMAVGGLVRVDAYPSDRTRLFIGAASGPDSEFGIVANRKGLFAGGEVPVGGRVALTAGFSREWRNGAADRTEGRFGAKIGF